MGHSVELRGFGYVTEDARLCVCYARDVDAAIEDLRARLEALAEELAELAFVRLREAAEAGEREVPEIERRLTRARRAVEKAVNLLETDKVED